MAINCLSTSFMTCGSVQATSLLDDMVGLERLVAEACSSRHSYAWPWNWSLGSQQPDPEMAPTGAGLQGKGSDDKDLDAKLSGAVHVPRAAAGVEMDGLKGVLTAAVWESQDQICRLHEVRLLYACHHAGSPADHTCSRCSNISVALQSCTASCMPRSCPTSAYYVAEGSRLAAI